MVEIDEQGALVTLRFQQPYGDEDAARYLAALRQVETKSAPFVMLTVLGTGGAFSPADEREQALWFKRSRDGMNRHCRAMAIVRPHVSEHMRHVFSKLWTFPVLLTTDEEEAARFLDKHAQALA
jgi:hypothetical protein